MGHVVVEDVLQRVASRGIVSSVLVSTASTCSSLSRRGAPQRSISSSSTLRLEGARGIHDRGDRDLRRHSEFSGKDLSYFDELTKERFVPCVVETSGGADRATFAFLLAAYDEEPDKEGICTVPRPHPALTSYKVAVLPLSRNERLTPRAREAWAAMRPHFMSVYGETQTIGRRYRRQDEIGTPLCVTVDFDSLEDRAVTIRDRDSMAQVRVPLAELTDRLWERLPVV